MKNLPRVKQLVVWLKRGARLLVQILIWVLALAAAEALGPFIGEMVPVLDPSAISSDDLMSPWLRYVAF